MQKNRYNNHKITLHNKIHKETNSTGTRMQKHIMIKNGNGKQ